MDPTRILATLADGRRRGLERRRERSAELRDRVVRLARLDEFVAGQPDRGRAGRVARELALSGESVSESWVGKIIRTVGPTVPHRRRAS